MSQNEVNQLWAQILVWTANGLGLIYNLPQLYHTYQTKKVDDISTLSLSLRLSSSVLWTFYCVYFKMWDVGISWFITFFSSLLILYYKIYHQIIRESRESSQQEKSIEIHIINI